MIGIKVCRGNSIPSQCSYADSFLNWGADISEVLLVNDDVALERGRVEIDEGWTNRINSSIGIVSRQYAYPGSFVGINDEGVITRGMLRSIRLSISKSNDAVSTSSSLTIERNV